jgi:hypothetical protein
MQIDESDEQRQNAASSICDSREPDSNVTVARERQYSKHRPQSLTTEEGMQIDESDLHH